MMIKLRFILILVFFCPLNSAWSTLPPREMGAIHLSVGEQRLISTPGLVKYSRGSSLIHLIQPKQQIHSPPFSSQDSLLIKALAPGHTDLWVWKADGSAEHRTIQIHRKPKETRPPELHQALEKLKEVEIVPLGKANLLRGEIKTVEEAGLIAALLDQFPKEIQNQTHISSPLLEDSSHQITSWIRTAGLQESLRTEIIGNSLWIRGHLPSPQTLHSVKNQITRIFPLCLFDISALVSHSQIIYVRVFLLELKKSALKSLGVYWGPNTLQTLELGANVPQNLLKLDLNLQHLEGSGIVRILSNPELVVRVPGEAELFSGGEFPINTRSRYSSQVDWKRHGLTLRLKVSQVAGTQVRLDIQTEVSQVDLKLGNQALPGVKSNRMTTQVDATLGSPLLLSGLLQERLKEDSAGIPFLQNLPILGRLFSSEDYLNERSELVAILYPHSAPPTGALLRRSIRSNPQPFEANSSQENFPWSAFE